MVVSSGRVLAFLSAILFVATGAVQQNPKCPTTKVSCPFEVKQGEKLIFIADVKGGDPNVTPTYNWTVSASAIESGQGTSSIQVNTKDVGPDTSITATVELGGY